MLAVDALSELLTDATKRKMFEFIAKNRRLRHKDLAKAFEKEAREGLKPCEKLSELVEANMIGKEAAPISDFDSYYITADGLFAERQLRRIKQEVRL